MADAYLELREGPGRGYAVTQVVPRGEAVEVLYRRTEWFRVRTRRGIEGWAAEDAMRRMLLADGSAFSFDWGNRAGFTAHRLGAGRRGWRLRRRHADRRAPVLLVQRTAVAGADRLAVPGQRQQRLCGRTGPGACLPAGLAALAAPDAGHGSHLDQAALHHRGCDRTATTRQPMWAQACAIYLTRRFFLRGEYRHHLVFTSRDANEEIKEWKLELAFFF